MSSASDGRSDHPGGGAVEDAVPILARAGREWERRICWRKFKTGIK